MDHYVDKIVEEKVAKESVRIAKMMHIKLQKHFDRLNNDINLMKQNFEKKIENLELRNIELQAELLDKQDKYEKKRLLADEQRAINDAKRVCRDEQRAKNDAKRVCRDEQRAKNDARRVCRDEQRAKNDAKRVCRDEQRVKNDAKRTRKKYVKFREMLNRMEKKGHWVENTLVLSTTACEEIFAEHQKPSYAYKRAMKSHGFNIVEEKVNKIVRFTPIKKTKEDIIKFTDSCDVCDIVHEHKTPGVDDVFDDFAEMVDAGVFNFRTNSLNSLLEE